MARAPAGVRRLFWTSALAATFTSSWTRGSASSTSSLSSSSTTSVWPLNDWISYAYLHKLPVEDGAMGQLDVVLAYLNATCVPTEAAFLARVVAHLAREFGPGSLVWGVKGRGRDGDGRDTASARLPAGGTCSARANRPNPVEVYLYTRTHPWAVPTLQKFSDALLPFYTAANVHDALSPVKYCFAGAARGGSSACGAGTRELNEDFVKMMSLELPPRADLPLDLEIYTTCANATQLGVDSSHFQCVTDKLHHVVPEMSLLAAVVEDAVAARVPSTWVNRNYAVSSHGEPRPKTLYFNVRASVGGQRRLDAGTPALELLDATIAEYARLHGLDTPALWPPFKAFFWRHLDTATSQWWTVADKGVRGGGGVRTHSVYNYGLTAQAACDFVSTHDYATEFGGWLCSNVRQLDHNLFDMSVDFSVNEAGDGFDLLRTALGGGALG